MKSLTDWQHEFYVGQLPSYRAEWWWWALDQPNFREMSLLFREEDRMVLRSREQAIARHKQVADNARITR